MVGDVRNTPGRSMFVRLSGPDSGPGAAGRWTDAASAEHGDLLDVIRESCGLVEFRDVIDEARRFLRLPRPEPFPTAKSVLTPVPAGSAEAARRLFAMSRPIRRTLVETYLFNRGIKALHHADALRFHPRCYYRKDDGSPTETWPAMIAAVTDLSGAITGAHRTWLAPDGSGKAPIDTPRRALGGLLGHAVRFGVAGDVLAAGEGIETMLSLRCALPAMPMAAALSANHLPPSSSRRHSTVSTWSATLTLRAIWRSRCSPNEPKPLASRRWFSPRASETSTRICKRSAQTPFAQRCAPNSPLRTRFASHAGRQSGRGD